MSIKQKITVLLCSLAFVSSATAAVSAMPAAAAKCGGVETSIISCSQGGSSKNVQDTGVWGVLLLVLNIMTAGVGILAVGGVVWASILYASSSDNAEQTKRAKDTIKQIAIGILAYAGMYLLINFLIPGGVFK